MRLLPPDLEVNETEGFDPQKDIFQRRQFGVSLAKVIENSNEGLVIGLDAKWGEGKSTFVKMWRGYLGSEESGIASIYFDAFNNDYQRDPFYIIASEIYQLIEDRNPSLKEEFKEKAASALKVISKIGLRLGVKTITAGVLDETIFEDDIDSISDEITKATRSFVADRLEESKEDKQRVNEFKEFLSKLPEILNTNKPVVIIVDELDRCRPDFALNIIETIKHFFSLPGITFLLVLNKSQLEQSIKYQYGTAINASEYLQKFVNLWAILPSKVRGASSTVSVYAAYCLSQMEYKGERNSSGIFVDLAEYFQLSLREIEQSLSNFALLENSGVRGDSFGSACLSPFFSIVKVKYFDLYTEISRGLRDYDRIEKEANIGALINKGWANMTKPHPVKFCLFYCCTKDNQSQRAQLDNELGNMNVSIFGCDSAIDDIVPILNSFEQGI